MHRFAVAQDDVGFAMAWVSTTRCDSHGLPLGVLFEQPSPPTIGVRGAAMQTTPYPTTVLIVYYSRFGALKALAERIAEGARQVPDVSVTMLEVQDEPLDSGSAGANADLAQRRAVVLNQLTGADALIVGAPAYFGTVASPVKRLFEDALVANAAPGGDRSRAWQLHQFRNKVGAAFIGSGTPHGGNEMGLHSILTLFMHLGMVVVTPGQAEPLLENPSAPYGATAVTGAAGDKLPSPVEQAEAVALGKRVAQLATWLSLGRTEWDKLHGQAAGHQASATPHGSIDPTA
jgi:NAD(P)H dehydrogenase (quinone)